MADFKYSGLPTYGLTTKDIKAPKSDGSFQVFLDVEPDVTIISTLDTKSIEYFQSNANFVQQ